MNDQFPKARVLAEQISYLLKSADEPVKVLIEAIQKAGINDQFTVAYFDPMYTPPDPRKLDRRMQLIHVWSRLPDVQKTSTMKLFIEEAEKAMNQ